MQYTLLYQHKGIIGFKSETLIGNKLLVKFQGFKEGMTAVFVREDDGEQLYKKLNEIGECEIDKSYLHDGRIKCSVCIFDNKHQNDTWKCQPFIVERNANNIRIRPDDEDIQETMSELQQIISNQSKLTNELMHRIVQLEDRIEKLTSGYDII